MRKVLIALVVIIIVIAAVLGYAIYNIDSLIGPYKDDMIAQAEQQTGRKIKLDRINVNIWGGIGVRLQDFAISEDPAFGSGNFVQARNLQVNVALLPLLSREIQVSSVILNDPVISLVRNRQGVFNFASLSSPSKASSPSTGSKGQRAPVPAEGDPQAQKPSSKSETPSSPPAETAPEPAPGGSAGMPMDLVVSRLEISNGQVNYEDETENRKLELKKLDLTVTDFSQDRPFDVSLAVAVLEDDQNLNLDGTIGPLGASPKPDSIPVDARINITSLSFDSLQKALPEIEKQMPKELQIAGGMQAKDLAVRGNLEALAVAGTLDLTGSGIEFGDVLQKPEGTALRVTADGNAEPNRIGIRSIDLVFHTLELKGKGQVDLGKQTALDLAFDMAPLELEGWEKIVPLLKEYQLGGRVSADAVVKGRVDAGAAPDIQGQATLENVTAKAPGLAKPVEDLSAKVAFSGKSATLQQTSLRVGKTRMSATAQVQNFAPLALSYEFSAPEIWLADFQPRPEDEVLKEVKSTGNLTNAKGLSFEGNVTSTQGSVAKVAYTDFKTDLDLKDPWLTIKSAQLKALKGTIDAKGKMQIKGESPQFNLDTNVAGLDIKEYAAGVPGMPKLEGIINADLTASGRGRDWEAMKPTIEGKGKAEVVDGRLLDFNIAEQVLEGITGIPGLTSLISSRIRDKYPQIFKGETTEFEELNTVFNAANAKTNIEQLNLKAKDYGVKSKGSVDFDGQADLASVLSLSKELSSDLASAAAPVQYLANDQGQVEIPFVLTGVMPNVRPRPDVSYLGKQMVNKGISGLAERFIPGMGKKTSEGEATEKGTDTQDQTSSKGLRGMAEKMIPGLSGTTASKESSGEAAKPAAQGEGEAKSEAAKKVDNQPTQEADSQPTQTTAAETKQPEESKKKPSTEERVKDAINQGLKLFGQ